MLDWCPLHKILVTVAQIARLLRSASFSWRAPPSGSPRSRIAVRARRRATPLVARCLSGFACSPFRLRFDIYICLLACTVARMRRRSAIYVFPSLVCCSSRVLSSSRAAVLTCCCARVPSRASLRVLSRPSCSPRVLFCSRFLACFVPHVLQYLGD